MKIDADKTAHAIDEWFSDTVKSAPSSAQEMGQFFFGVSATSIGTLIAFEKLDTSAQVSLLLGVALLLLTISLFIALSLILPIMVNVEKQQDLLVHYSVQIHRLFLRSWLWFVVWFLGLAFGIYHALYL